MCKVIAIANYKGGVGKTTTTVNLGIGLAKKGKKVLLMDADPKGNLTASLGIQDPDELNITLANIMFKIINAENSDPKYGILRHNEGVDFISGNIKLLDLETALANIINRKFVLRTYVEQQKTYYDYILIDCPARSGMMLINSLACTDSVLIPTQAAYLSINGLQSLIKTIGNVKRQVNPKIEIEGILFTMFNNCTNYAKEIRTLLVENYGNHVQIFKNYIPMSTKVAEAPATGMSIYKYDPHGNATSAYESLVKQILANK